MREAKRKFCSTSRMVKPSAFNREMVRPICCTITGARPSVGSSSRSSRAPVRRIRPMASICCSPPESLVPWLESRSLRFGNSSKTCSSASPPARTSGGSSRFSWTLRLAKMPRSSGQNAIPSLAIRLEGSAIVSVPSSRTEPSRRPTIPIFDLSVVVLPTPLRPRRVTTSPRRTSNSTPCRMCDSPYQACRPPTESSAVSGMLGPQVGLDDFGMLRDRIVIPLRDDLAAREHRDPVREVGDYAQVVLDHQHGAIGCDPLDQRRGALHVLVSHAGGRLVEQQHFRLERERRHEKPGEQIEAGGLARAVRPDQRVNAAAADLQVDIVHRDETRELLGQVPRFKNAVVAHAPRPAVMGPAAPPEAAIIG